MQRLVLLLAVAVVPFMAGSGGIRAQENGGSSSASLTGKDYAQIEQLYARYNQGSDFRDGSLWLSVFAEDAVFAVGDQEYIGQEELAEYRKTSFARTKGSPPRRHWNSSLVVTSTADGAVGRAYFQVFDVSSIPPTPTTSGHYNDVFTKTADGWRIQRRTISIDGR